MLMDIGTTPMNRTRVDDDGNLTTAEIRADDHGNGKLYLKVDADIEVGDLVEYELPNGKPRTMKIIEHNVLQAPAGMQMAADLDHTECSYEVVTRKPIGQPQRVNMPGLHPLISDASGSRMATKHYDDAIFNACKAVEERVQALAGHPKSAKGFALSGKGLMTTVFNEEIPALDITSDGANEAQKGDEREGFKYLFMGVAQALRNPRGHGPNLQTSGHAAMEMLATTSMLMRSLDRAELRKAGQEQRRMRGDLKSPIPPGLAAMTTRRSR